MQLEASNQELEAFSYSISHDLRGPLRHIKGFAQMLRETTEHLLSPEHKKYIDNINRSVAEMSNLIDALLNFSRLGRAEINKIKIDLNTIVQDIIKHENEVCSLKKINWIIAALPEVYADPILLKQVFNNYISNAIKYSRNSPDPTIEIGFDDSNPNEFIFYVKDNGVGFDMKYADKLFCVFQRLHSSSEFEGVGIGLANVRRIVSRHGGRVWAQSQPNKGATFFFSLPK
jgi:light-regulated signal transduction histidine kinase (bacteriophytochrome)